MSSTDDKYVDPNKSETDTNTDHSSEAESSESEEENMIIRAKWTIDGAATIDEAIEKLNDFIEHLRALKVEGWALREPIDDDYGFLYKSETN
jgi:hypothetical protein